MSSRDFRHALQQAQAELIPDRASPEVDALLRAGIIAKLARRQITRPVIRWGLGVSLAAAAAVFLWLLVPSLFIQPHVGPFVLAQKAPQAVIAVAGDGVVAVRGGDCTLEERSTQSVLRLKSGSLVQRVSEGIRVIAGRVAFVVEPRPKNGAPVQVLVSGGVIQVVGTKFEIVETGQTGNVFLEKGSIRFVATDGTATMLVPGETRAWLQEPTTAGWAAREETVVSAPAALPEQKPGPVTPVRELAAKKVEAASIFSRVTALRSRQRYEEAVDELARALDGSFPPATRERLSFERGSILTYLLKDRPRACAQWAKYDAEFPVGDYRKDVARAKAEVGCGAD